MKKIIKKVTNFIKDEYIRNLKADIGEGQPEPKIEVSGNSINFIQSSVKKIFDGLDEIGDKESGEDNVV